MTKDDYIKYWVETANQNWAAAQDLFVTKHFLESLFLAHLSLEKLCKAAWVKMNTSNHPPRIHNLVYLLKQTPVEMEDERLDFLLMFNDFQMEGRYPDYRQKVYEICTEANTKTLLENAEKQRTWLLSKLQ